MIATVSGEVILIEEDSVVVQVGGVGLRVYAPAGLLLSLHAGEPVLMYTHLVVREDALTLYGFQTAEERAYFAMLLGVSGVGPRTALAVLSALNPEAIRRAVLTEQDAVFSRVPGVGKKTAHNILFYLQDRIPKAPGLEMGAPTSGDIELLEALTSLGYSVVEAQAAIQTIPHDAPAEIEERLRIALQYFSK
jgi:Holliday junction DNA helicase RuvA